MLATAIKNLGIEFKSLDAFNGLMINVPVILQEEIVRALAYLGEQCIIKIRDRGPKESWFDQTGNLRSSIGYAIYGHGRKAIESAFDVVKNGSQGATEGKRMIDELATKYAETFALVVVAGMDYADAVEAMDNKDVLATTEIWAKREVQKYLDKAKERAMRRITKLYQQ